jgi:hypothetical protein
MGKIIERFAYRGEKGKLDVETLLDSGASASVIRSDVAARLTDFRLDMPARTLRMVNGKKWLRISEAVLLNVRMKGKDLDGSFYVVDEMPREAVIGVDFMQKWDIRLEPRRHEFTVGLDPDSIEMA